MNNDNNNENYDESVTPDGVSVQETVTEQPEKSSAAAGAGAGVIQSKAGKIAALLRNTFVAITLAALVTLVVFSLWLTAFQVQKDDMSPAVQKGETVIAVKKSTYGKGDIIAFYHNNDILIKRIVAFGGDIVNIDENGALYVNEAMIDEPYAENPGTGDCDIEFPYEVPEGRLFVLGDNRTASGDSRLKKIGTVSDMLIIGKVTIGVWPLSSIGIIE